MKPVFTRFILSTLAILTLFIFSTCKDKVIEKRKYTANVPVYMTYETMRSATIESLPAQTMQTTGKIYFYNNYIFINEVNEGVHIIDNNDPTNPQNIGFIDIPGNIDVTTKGTYMYADSYVDLMVLDISDLNNVTEVTRIENVFTYAIPEYDINYPIGPIDMNEGVIIGWTIGEVEEVLEVEDNSGGWLFMAGAEDGITPLNDGSSNGGRVSVIAIAGSMARFATHNNSLYTVNTSDIEVFDISNHAAPVQTTNSLTTSRTIETLFVYKDNLYVGTTTGMMIYDIVNAGSPSFVAEIDHFVSCDPVVVDNTTAYVTLRSGTECGGWQNILEVIDVTNLSNPVVLRDYEMSEPYGLGIDNTTLFVCDGSAGLKIYDVTDPLAIADNMIAHFPGINTFDAIPYNDVLMLIGSDGLYQYDYSDLTNIQLISFIPTE